MGEAETIARALRPTVRKALFKPDGQGDYSSSTYAILLGHGLVDRNFIRTPLGQQVRDILAQKGNFS